MLCTTQAARSACRRPLARSIPSSSVFLYRSIRANSTDAPGESSPSSGDQPPKPKKRTVPIADSFGDIFIRPAFSNDRMRSLGNNTSSLSGKLARRQVEANPQEYPVKQGREESQSRPRNRNQDQTRVAGRERQSYGQNRTQSASKERILRSEKGEISGTVVGARENNIPKRQPKESEQVRAQRAQVRAEREQARAEREKVMVEKAAEVEAQKKQAKLARLETLQKKVHIETTDLELLFGAPKQATPVTAPKVSAGRIAPSRPVRASPKVAKPGRLSPFVQRALERRAGDYKHYLFGAPRVIRTDSLTTMGPTGYARLALMRRQDVGLAQRRNGLKIVATLTKGINTSPQTSTLRT